MPDLPNTKYVSNNWPQEPSDPYYADLASAISASSAGDTIVLGPGVYTGSANYGQTLSEARSLVGLSPENTVILVDLEDVQGDAPIIKLAGNNYVRGISFRSRLLTGRELRANAEGLQVIGPDVVLDGVHIRDYSDCITFKGNSALCDALVMNSRIETGGTEAPNHDAGGYDFANIKRPGTLTLFRCRLYGRPPWTPAATLGGLVIAPLYDLDVGDVTLNIHHCEFDLKYAGNSTSGVKLFYVRTQGIGAADRTFTINSTHNSIRIDPNYQVEQSEYVADTSVLLTRAPVGPQEAHIQCAFDRVEYVAPEAGAPEANLTDLNPTGTANLRAVVTNLTGHTGLGTRKLNAMLDIAQLGFFDQTPADQPSVPVSAPTAEQVADALDQLGLVERQNP